MLEPGRDMGPSVSDENGRLVLLYMLECPEGRMLEPG